MGPFKGLKGRQETRPRQYLWEEKCEEIILSSPRKLNERKLKINDGERQTTSAGPQIKRRRAGAGINKFTKPKMEKYCFNQPMRKEMPNQ